MEIFYLSSRGYSDDYDNYLRNFVLESQGAKETVHNPYKNLYSRHVDNLLMAFMRKKDEL